MTQLGTFMRNRNDLVTHVKTYVTGLFSSKTYESFVYEDGDTIEISYKKSFWDCLFDLDFRVNSVKINDNFLSQANAAEFIEFFKLV